jgi:hypothetical protein
MSPRSSNASTERRRKKSPKAPAVQAECPATFGNSDILSIAIADPTP